MKRAYGVGKDGMLVRVISDRKLRRLKKGKEVYIKVHGIVVCLTRTPDLKVRRKIAKLKGELKELMKGITNGV